MSNIPNLPPYTKSGTKKLNFGSDFTLEAVLLPFLRMHIKSGQNGSKRGQTGKKSGSALNQAILHP